MREGGRHLIAMWDHPDQIEGPRAFAEKREPRWVEPEIEH
jgi:enoyl-CoA hydratase/carnithine racemase